MLEILSSIPEKPVGAIVFAHGICHGAWCWHHFMDFFSSHGYACYALSYCGHGKSDGKKGLIKNNAEDVAEVVEKATGFKPYLIGHSMGGAVVQKYAGDNHESLSGLILLASATAPKMPYLKTIASLTKPDMWLSYKKAMGWKVNSLQGASFFTGSKSGVSENDMILAEEMLKDESKRVLMLDLYRRYSKNYKLSCPVLVIGSNTDAYFPEKSLEQTRDTYKKAGTSVEYVLLDGLCHDIMLDRRWEEAAEKILHFCERR